MCVHGVCRRNAHRKTSDVLVFGVWRVTIPLPDRYRATVLADDKDWSGLSVFRWPAVFSDPWSPHLWNVMRLGAGFEGGGGLRVKTAGRASNEHRDRRDKQKYDGQFQWVKTSCAHDRRKFLMVRSPGWKSTPCTSGSLCVVPRRSP